MLGKFKSLFIESEPSDEPVPPTVPQPKVVEKAVPIQAPIVPGQSSPEIVAILEQAIADANLPGFDYLEFKAALTNLASLPITEEQKFKTVFATIQSMNVTKEALLSAVDHYVGVLDKKKGEFDSFVEGLIQTEVTAKETQIASIDEAIAKDAQEIERLTNSIKEKQQKKQEVSIEIFNSKNNISSKQSAFVASYNDIKNKLLDDKNKLNSFL